MGVLTNSSLAAAYYLIGFSNTTCGIKQRYADMCAGYDRDSGGDAKGMHVPVASCPELLVEQGPKTPLI